VRDAVRIGTPEVSTELPWGIYQGRESIERIYLGFHGELDKMASGELHLHALTTPVIDVARDLRSARAVWISPGVAAGRYGGDKFEASWTWNKYGCDFIREAGKWKIWHRRLYGIFTAPYESSWVEREWDGRAPNPALPPEHRPDREPTSPWWQYRRDAAHPNTPAPPVPHDTHVHLER
jgi:hypothetical protein